jgi:GTPase SAR1 family protein
MYYPNTNAILYVVDSHDKPRLAKAAEELTKVLEVFAGGFRRRFCRECRCW